MSKTFLALYFLLGLCIQCISQSSSIVHDEAGKTIIFGNNKMKFRLDYGDGINISEFAINGRELIKGAPGIYSKFSVNGASHSTLQLLKKPGVTIKGSNIRVNNIRYGNDKFFIDETWNFRIDSNDVVFEMERILPATAQLEQVGFPCFVFKNVNTWEGAFRIMEA